MKQLNEQKAVGHWYCPLEVLENSKDLTQSIYRNKNDSVIAFANTIQLLEVVANHQHTTANKKAVALETVKSEIS